MNPQIKSITPNDPEYAQLLALRDEVLRQPLGMSIHNDDLSRDGDDLILIALEGGKTIGCVMLKPYNSTTGKLRQMAVANAGQGKGIGRMLVQEAELAALNLGYSVIELHARETAIPFYEKLGYTAEGPVFTEVNIPHRMMKKSLRP